MSQRLLQLEEYEANNNTIVESICLEHGHNYRFSIFDSFGDGVSLILHDSYCVQMCVKLNLNSLVNKRSVALKVMGHIV